MKKNDIYNSVNVDLNTNKSNYINESNKVKYIYKSIFFSPIILNNFILSLIIKNIKIMK